MNENNYEIKKLDWDTKKFKSSVYEIIFQKEIKENTWEDINNEIVTANLVYLKNPTNYRGNSKIIATKTNAFLIDTNVLLKKELISLILRDTYEYDYSNIVVRKQYNWDIKDLLTFNFSRFFVDKNLFNLGGKSIYTDWVRNSQNKPNKDFIFYQEHKKPIGFVLFSKNTGVITIELISVHEAYEGKKIGTTMLNYLFDIARQSKVSRIYVGTQISNKYALNFYIKNGFLIDSTTDIYHWWR